MNFSYIKILFAIQANSYQQTSKKLCIYTYYLIFLQYLKNWQEKWQFMAINKYSLQ